MKRLARALGYAVLATIALRWLASGSLAIVIGPWLPGFAIAVTGVAFGLERLTTPTGAARRAPVGLAFGVATVALVVGIQGLPVQSVWSGLVACFAAAVAVPLIGVAMEAFPGKSGRGHLAAGLVGICALLPLGVYFLPWWLHPVAHWNPLFWVHHTFLRLQLTPEQLEASGIHFPASFEWEYPVVPILEAAIYAWLLTRRIRRLEDQAGA